MFCSIFFINLVIISAISANDFANEAIFIELSERVSALEARIREVENREKLAFEDNQVPDDGYDLSQKKPFIGDNEPIRSNLPQVEEKRHSGKSQRDSKWETEIEQKVRNLHDLVKWIDLRFTFVLREVRQLKGARRRSPRIVAEEENGSGGDEDYFFIVEGDIVDKVINENIKDSEEESGDATRSVKIDSILADIDRMRETISIQGNLLKKCAKQEDLEEAKNAAVETSFEVSNLKQEHERHELNDLERDDALREAVEELERDCARTANEVKQWMFVSDAMKLSHTKIFSVLTEHSARFAAMHSRAENLELRMANIQVEFFNLTKNFTPSRFHGSADEGDLIRLQIVVDNLQNQLQNQTEKIDKITEEINRKANTDALERTSRSLKKVAEMADVLELEMVNVNATLSHNQRAVKHLELDLPKICSNRSSPETSAKEVQLIKPSILLPSHFVRCENGWTVIQLRYDGDTDFNRSFEEYRWPFGKVYDDHWLGNEYIHAITTDTDCSARFETWDLFNVYRVAFYRHFSLGDYSSQYRLSIRGYDSERSNLTDAMRFHENRRFSSVDRDEDTSSTHCARYYASGWWFSNCMKANLNGKHELGIIWFDTKTNDWIHLRRTRISVSPNNANYATQRLIDDHIA